MFGHHKRKREKRKMKRAREEFEHEKKTFEEQSPQREKERAEFRKSQTSERAKQAGEERSAGRKAGREDAEEFLRRDVQGLDTKKRNALQYEANRNIQRDVQHNERKLLGDQSRRGISNKSGVAYAQQRDLQRAGNEAQGAVHRDLNKLDSDLALKKKAAMFAGGEGEATQRQLDRQLAEDEFDFAEEKKRNRNTEDRFNRQFSRV
jgi:hypothetical protein